jgi:hypothetical protein
MKEGEQQTERYEVQVAVLLDSHHQLDEQFNELFKEAGLLFLYSDQGKPIIQHLEQADFYDQQAIELSRKVSKEKPIVFNITRLISSSKKENQQQDYLDIIEHPLPDLPDQSHLPSWEQEWITPELKELFFLQPKSNEQAEENNDVLRTYLILDGHVYTAIKGVFDLDLDLINRVPVQCLYKGRAAEELKYVAPYLIDMILPKDAYNNKDEVPDFHKSYFAKHWGNDAAMFFRTKASMEEVHNHFRKFTKITNDESKSLFFRFYDQKILAPYLTAVESWAERLSQLYATDTENPIHNIICSDGKNSAIVFSPTQALMAFDHSNHSSQPLCQRDYDICLEIGFINQAKKLLVSLYKNLATSHALTTKPEHLLIATDTIKRMRSYGLKTPLYLETLVAWSLLLHPEFEQQDPENIMEQILGMSRISQHEKFQALSRQMLIVYGERI